MPPLYVTTQGAKLRYRRRRLVVEKDDEVIASVPSIHVDEVLVMGNVSVTTPALGFLLGNDLPVTFMTIRGRYKGRLVGPSGGQGRLRLRQYARALDEAWALATARSIVAVKLHNTRTLLRRYARRIDEPDASRALTEAADQMTALIDRAGRCRTLNALSGAEGRGAAVAFSVFRYLIRVPGWSFKTRNRRPPRDPVTALLSFGYTILTHQVESAVRAVGLDPYIGFLHQTAYNRPSLALDLVEPFRSIVVDSVVLRCLNNEIIRPDHFRFDPDGEYPVLLTADGRDRFIRELENRLNVRFKHPARGERATYRRCFELEARQLARCLQTGDVFQPFKVR
jgi:CRISPR-associated protein Cas1